jgi:hypothetical protein
MGIIQLYRGIPETYESEPLGSITEDQLEFLIENLEAEFEKDEECFLSHETFQYLKEQGADSDLVSILERAISGNKDGVDIFYAFE